MQTFKIGDRVKRIGGPVADSNFYTIGNVYTVFKVVDEGIKYQDDQGGITVGAFKYWILDTPAHTISDNATRAWSFNVTSLSMIDLDTIRKDLSYKDPIAIVKFDDKIFVAVDKILMAKAKILEISPPAKFYNILEKKLDSSREIKMWVNWAKQVKDADWGEHACKCTVKVILPKI